jgi:hypothetical protein
MRNHMLTYHVGVPLAVFTVLVVVGTPVAGALRYAIAAGCLSMVFMMVGGGHRHHRQSMPLAHGDSTSTPRR